MLVQTKDPSLLPLCYAGCLFTLPGSQKAGVQRRFKRKADDSVYFDGPEQNYDLSKFVPLEVCPPFTSISYFYTTCRPFTLYF